ncbi:hypothetical protein [Nocardia asiatica]|uniref:hypothetical protein n=1 Tax=Nocardia asiatica TaxID=209252 RepID=UPI003EE408AF
MESEEDRYRRYVDRKWFRGERARLPKDYQRERDRWSNSREFGNIFRDGMCQMLGRTEERGWKQERYYRTKHGARFHDSASVRDRHAMEFKAGEVRREALNQLKKDAQVVRDGWVVEWYVVAGAKIDSQVAAKLKALEARYPGQFLTVTVTREQFAKAIELGKQRERERAREQPTKAVEQTRALSQAPTKADTQRIEQERAEARADERAMQAMLDSHTQHQHAQQAEQQRTPDTRGEVGQTRDTASERDPADAARTVRKAAEQERAERIARAMREGLPPEVARLLIEGQAQPLSTALQSPSHDTPQVTRGGTLGQDRTRGQSREQ